MTKLPHTEILSPDDPEWGNRHKMQRWRDEGDLSPWDGDKYLHDYRCPRCRADAQEHDFGGSNEY